MGSAGGPARAWLFRLLVHYAQAKAERTNPRNRLETIRRDRKWLKALGFVGENAS
jgi:preprotein translocase subunit SecA